LIATRAGAATAGSNTRHIGPKKTEGRHTGDPTCQGKSKLPERRGAKGGTAYQRGGDIEGRRKTSAGKPDKPR